MAEETENINESETEAVAMQIAEALAEKVSESPQRNEQPAEDTQTSKKEKTRRRKWNYHLMLFMDNDKGEIHQLGISSIFVDIFMGILLVALISTIVGWSVNSSIRKRVQAENAALTEQVDTLTAQVDELTTQNSELSDKVSILSDTVQTKVEAEKSQEQEDEAAHMPEGFPLSSSASMITDADDPNTVLFNCSSGANVIAAGAGTVIEVTPDVEYGNCVRIDHGNGYITEYYNSSSPLVKEGDEVLEGSIIYVVENDSDTMAYKVYYNDEEVDPMTIIKIDG